jgi:hypothetical protein
LAINATAGLLTMSTPEIARALSDLTALGRVRLSKHFFMREMLYSEVANTCGVPNIPEAPDLAIEAGRNLSRFVLEPLREAFGHIAIRSAYRSPTLNAHCHDLHVAGVKDSWCTCNEDNYAHHIWDHRDAQGFLGAVATVVIPGYLNHFDRTGDWRPLAWWIRDHVEHYAQVQFFRTQSAFNIRWYEGPSERSIGYLDPPTRFHLTAAGEPGFEGDHSAQYAHIIPSR